MCLRPLLNFISRDMADGVADGTALEDMSIVVLADIESVADMV